MNATLEMMTKEDVLTLFNKWNAALQTGDPDKVTALYAKNAILLPTVSNMVRHNHEEIRDYFVQFLAMKPSGVIDEANVKIFDQVAINSGVYTFALDGGKTVQARYTYVYELHEDEWLISEHHSSAMPEG